MVCARVLPISTCVLPISTRVLPVSTRVLQYTARVLPEVDVYVNVYFKMDSLRAWHIVVQLGCLSGIGDDHLVVDGNASVDGVGRVGTTLDWFERACARVRERCRRG